MQCSPFIFQIFIGLGFPYEGPAPLEAISQGCVFFNPGFNPPKSSKNTKFFQGKPTSREVCTFPCSLPFISWGNGLYIIYAHIWNACIRAWPHRPLCQWQTANSRCYADYIARCDVSNYLLCFSWQVRIPMLKNTLGNLTSWRLIRTTQHKWEKLWLKRLKIIMIKRLEYIRCKNLKL